MSELEKVGDILESKAESVKENQLYCDTCHKDTHKTEDHGKNGGARKGAGFPQGEKKKKTLEQQKVKEQINQRIMLHADRLINAQMQLAVGEQVLMVKIKERDDKGMVKRVTHEVVTDIETIKQFLDYEDGEGTEYEESPNDQDHFYYLSVRPSNNQAIDSLLNRAIGKAPDKLEVVGGFFAQPNLTIKVVGSTHDDISITDDGQISGIGSDGTDPQRETEPSDVDPGSPASS